MIPGPSIVRECSACGKFFIEDTVSSGNTFGARFWTDGKIKAPMLPDQPELVKCEFCGALIWIEEQKPIGEIAPAERRYGYKEPPPVNEGVNNSKAGRFTGVIPGLTPTFWDYARLIKAGVDDKQKERYLRLRAWWAGNDPRRKPDQSEPTPLDPFEIENLRALITFLNESDDHDRLMKAEALRELGEFEEAESLLATEFEGTFKKVASIIQDLNQRHITTVAEMDLE
ncbi:MAG: hypothetical protein SWC96_09885 [Thermodesulfobacteriota bacterium]|nr:hypothetical protein [Thermodesulfobacteriota bacterium]